MPAVRSSPSTCERLRVRISPYDDNGRVLIDVQQVIPLAEAAEYQVQIREKEHKGRQDRTERYDLRRKFWEGLLSRAKLRTPLHAQISPTDYHWVGTSSGIRGLNFNYLAFQTDGRVELYIDRGSGQTEANTKIFDTLRENREAIEAAFGGPLDWARLDDKQASRVSHPFSLGGYRSEESKWPEIQDAMIDAMIRLEKAVRPEIAKLRFGV
jgi:hypothetical protein